MYSKKRSPVLVACEHNIDAAVPPSRGCGGLGPHLRTPRKKNETGVRGRKPPHYSRTCIPDTAQSCAGSRSRGEREFERERFSLGVLP